MDTNSICIIGGGAAGIALARVLNDRGIQFTWLEKGTRLGGLWVYNNDSGMSAIYQSLTTNTSRTTMGFPGFPLPEQLPDFPPHHEVLKYLDAYIERYNLQPLATLGCEVEKLEEAPDGAFLVSSLVLATGQRECRRYESVILATGMNWDPALPSLEGSFSGIVMHSVQYREPSILKGQRVLVVGAGPSGADIATEAAREAGSATLSLRHGMYAFHRYGKDGRPSDTKNAAWLGLLPWKLRQYIMTRAVQPKALPGFPQPAYQLLQRTGHLKTKPGIASLEDRTVQFVDGTREDFDVIIFATGFRESTPFLSSELEGRLRSADGQLSLYLNIVPPDVPGLYFTGFVRQLGPIFPSFHEQALFLADLLQGKCKLPAPESMRQSLTIRHANGEKRYSKPYKSLEVDLHIYWLQLRIARCLRGLPVWRRWIWTIQSFFSILFRPIEES
eukprot:jgi/Botrbrau1/805/Bobra.0352s0002.1